MINKFLIYTVFYLFMGVVAFPLTAQAQSRGCNFESELIFKIKDGRIGAYSVWDAVYGEIEGIERFASALPVDGSDTLAVGEVYDTPDSAPKLTLVKFDYRGRDVWTKVHEIKGLSGAVKILPVGDNFMVLANVGASGKKRPGVWVGTFDQAGELLKGGMINHPTGALQASDIVPGPGGQGFLMSANIEARGEAPHGALYLLGSKGQALSHREYAAGLGNRLNALAPAYEGNGYLASGYIEAEDGRKAGWLLRLNDDGSIIWQQQYVRGSGAQFLSVSRFNEQYFVVSGFADPHALEGTRRAGWVMMVEARNGNMVWQRYYTGSYKYSARDVLVDNDGLISVLLDGQWDQKKKPKSADGEAQEDNTYDPTRDLGERKDFDYANLLTIDPRGNLRSSDPFYNGEGSDAAQLYFGKRGERMIVGSTKMVYSIEAVADQLAMIKRSEEGWVLAASPSDPYKDPCKR